MNNKVELTEVDDNSAAGDGVTYWFSVGDADVGICRGRLGDDGCELRDSWLFGDGIPTDYPDEFIDPHAQDLILEMIEGL